MSLVKCNYKKTTLAMALMTAWGAQAATVEWNAYEIVNLDEMFSLSSSQLPATRNGYGGDINNQGVVLGIAQGVNDTSGVEDDGIIGEVEDVIFPTVDALSPDISRAFQGNNFAYEINEGNGWTAIHSPINNQSAPDDTENDATSDAFYFGIKADGDVRVGRTSGTQSKVADPTPDEGDEDPFFYVRDFDARGVVQSGGNETQLVPPYTEYTSEVSGSSTVDIGGYSVAAAVNSLDQVAGYVGTTLASGSEDVIDSCWNVFLENPTTANPMDVCIQAQQNSGTVQYQVRPAVWQLDPATGAATLTKTLDLPFTPLDSDTTVYTAMGLGINAAGVVVGESNQRNDSNNLMSYRWAQIWMPDGTIVSPSKLNIEGLRGSTATAINDNGIAVGTVQRYISGYPRTKFWVYDVNSDEEYYTEPSDFNPGGQTDLSSLAKDINSNGLVVGNIEVDVQAQLPRRRNAFVYDYAADQAGDSNAFVNLNNLLTCNSRGYVADENGSVVDDEGNRWSKFMITDDTTFAQSITYEADFTIVEANGVNDNGDIVGTALVQLPRVKVEDGKVVTEEVTDPETGETVTKIVIETDGFGKPITDQLPRPVVMRANGGASSCTIPLETDGDSTPNERSGASLPLGWVLALLPLAWFRRRR
ncbi:Protein of unknown function [Ferrimonas sediminum]|uniref:GlyGly-CTERM domain-containing protein n=1 Tax=Ferrimonas sediminum TaxID=718193 RepID=A0A1G8VVS1_9GAMM|nr:DUF3466 family protein [Ferrimonas sediminum]SDJ70168.1 Protein of unknown function [Ferrimonas sediminum]